MIRLLFGSLIAALLFIRPAYAYIDPGTASLILQGIIGGIAATGFFFRSHLYRLKSLFRSKRDDAATSESSRDKEENVD